MSRRQAIPKHGGGVIGAGEYEQVKEVVFETIKQANTLRSYFNPVKEYPLPQPDYTQFFLVTETGVLATQPILEEKQKNITISCKKIALAFDLLSLKVEGLFCAETLPQLDTTGWTSGIEMKSVGEWDAYIKNHEPWKSNKLCISAKTY